MLLIGSCLHDCAFIGNTNRRFVTHYYSSRRQKISGICWQEKLLEHSLALIEYTDG